MSGHEQDLIPVRPGETDDERRLRELINRTGGQVLRGLDAAISLRSAPIDAQRIRHMARADLIGFGLKAMHALALSQPVSAPKD